MFISALVASFFATLSLASHVGRQQPACLSNGVPNASNFTLLAVGKSDTNIQKSLALKIHNIPQSTWLASAESIGSFAANHFSLTDNEITAYFPDGGVFAFSGPVTREGGLLLFLPPHGNSPTSPSKVYCELPGTSALWDSVSYELAVYSDTDHFSLCQSSASNQSVIVYNAKVSSEDVGYLGKTCVDVTIYMLPVNEYQQ